MLGEFWSLFIQYLKERAIWPRIQLAVILVFAFFAVQFSAYVIFQTQLGIPPSTAIEILGAGPTLSLFLHSYVFRRIVLIFAGVTLAILIVRVRRLLVAKASATPDDSRRAGTLVSVVFVSVSMTVLLALGIAGWRYLSPSRVSTIRILFLEEPRDFEADTLAYLVYELNRLQRDWVFEIQFQTFNASALKKGRQEACTVDLDPLLCYVDAYAADISEKSRSPVCVIGITGAPLGRFFYAVNRQRSAVISTSDRDALKPLGVYQYLMYCLIVQSVALHLSANCTAAPVQLFEPSTESHGGVFQFKPTRSLMKASILAAGARADEEQLLLNCFGPEYVRGYANLLTLEWLKSGRVAENLERYFGVSTRELQPTSR